MLRGEIDATDRAIDALVYQLYDLSADEIKIVEGGE
jgi:type II restriction/modification system DNA methylase subunit YeeA